MDIKVIVTWGGDKSNFQYKTDRKILFSNSVKNRFNLLGSSNKDRVLCLYIAYKKLINDRMLCEISCTWGRN